MQYEVIMKKIICFVLFFIVLLSFSGLALKVSPAVFDMTYSEEPVEFDVSVINDDERDIAVEISFESYEGKIDYTDYFEITNFDSNRIEIKRGEIQTIHFRMTYPEMENFGHVRFAFIKFYQVPLSGGQITATVALLVPLDADVPYPDKFISITLPTFDYVGVGETAKLNATLNHLGIVMIDSLSGHFNIVRKDYEKEIIFETLTGVYPGSSNVVEADFDTTGLTAGIYDVNVTVNYDGTEKTSIIKKLIVGEESIEITDLSPTELVANQVNSVKLTLTNLWASDLSPSIKVGIYNSGGLEVTTFDVGIFTLPAAQSKEIYAGFDLRGYELGDYVFRITLDLNGNLITRDFNVTLVKGETIEAPGLESKWYYFIALGVLVVVLLVIAGYLIYKKNEKKGE